jgi:hypothetical protein
MTTLDRAGSCARARGTHAADRIGLGFEAGRSNGSQRAAHVVSLSARCLVAGHLMA